MGSQLAHLFTITTPVFMMPSFKLILALAFILTASLPNSAWAGGCRPTDDEVTAMRDWVERMIVSTDSTDAAVRLTRGLPSAPATVSINADSSTCAAAALAYERYIAKDSTRSTTNRSVYVIEVLGGGVQRFIVVDPLETQYSGEWQTFIVFDENFANVFAVIAA